MKRTAAAVASRAAAGFGAAPRTRPPSYGPRRRLRPAASGPGRRGATPEIDNGDITGSFSAFAAATTSGAACEPLSASRPTSASTPARRGAPPPTPSSATRLRRPVRAPSAPPLLGRNCRRRSDLRRSRTTRSAILRRFRPAPASGTRARSSATRAGAIRLSYSTNPPTRGAPALGRPTTLKDTPGERPERRRQRRLYARAPLRRAGRQRVERPWPRPPASARPPTRPAPPTNSPFSDSMPGGHREDQRHRARQDTTTLTSSAPPYRSATASSSPPTAARDARPSSRGATDAARVARLRLFPVEEHRHLPRRG